MWWHCQSLRRSNDLCVRQEANCRQVLTLTRKFIFIIAVKHRPLRLKRHVVLVLWLLILHIRVQGSLAFPTAHVQSYSTGHVMRRGAQCKQCIELQKLASPTQMQHFLTDPLTLCIKQECKISDCVHENEEPDRLCRRCCCPAKVCCDISRQSCLRRVPERIKLV